MPIDAESLYLQLGQLVAEMPELGAPGPVSPEVFRWLGQAVYLVDCTGDFADVASIKAASDGLAGQLRETNARKIVAAVYRALARAEGLAPASAKGGFVSAGSPLDALRAIGKVLAQAKQDVLIVDPYMDATVFMDFAPMAPEGASIRLLTDSFSTKQTAVEPAKRRWVEQYGALRPIEVRMSRPRALHDRLILANGKDVWSLTQSLKNFAGRAPALVQRVDSDIARMKVEAYGELWSAATPLS